MNDEERQRRALRRYALIDPMVDRPLQRGEKTALLKETARKHHISLATLKRYCRNFRLHRLDGLLPAAARADKGRSRRILPDALALAVRLREEVPQRSTATLIAMVEEVFPQYQGQLKRSTLDRHLHQLGKSRVQLRATQPKPRRQFAKTTRGALWQTDLCILSLEAHDEHGEVGPVVVASILDDATRYLPHIGAYLRQDAGVVEDCFKKAALKHGLPMALFFDNGAQFVCEQFTGALEALGVRALRAQPGSPESKGKQERFFRTLQDSLVPELKTLGRTLSVVEVESYLTAWVAEHYHERPHRELPAEAPTPRTRWEQDPTPLRPVDPVRLEAAFLQRAMRKVSRTQLVSLEGRRYLAGDVGSGTRVEVRYHPRRPESVQIWLDGQFIQVANLYVTPEDAPRKPEPPPAHPGPPTGLNYAQMLLLDYQDRLREQYRRAGFAQPPAEPPPFTEGAFVAMLARALERTLEPLEREGALEIWHRFGALNAEWTAQSLGRFIQQRGLGLHIAYYLDAVAQEHRRRRGVNGDV